MMDISRICRFTGLAPYRSIIERFVKSHNGYVETMSVDGITWVLAFIIPMPTAQDPKAEVRVTFDSIYEYLRVMSFDVDSNILWERAVWEFNGKKVNITRFQPGKGNLGSRTVITKARRSMIQADYQL